MRRCAIQAIKLVIRGRMVPKKNAKRVLPGRKFPISSPRWRKYEKDAKKQLKSQYNDAILCTDRMALHVTAVYYCPDRRYPDLSGMLETVGDLLEGIVYENDRQIGSWDGSRIRLDNEDPRIEVEVCLIAAKS